MSRWKTVFCLIPRRLARHVNPHDLNGPTLEMIGWVWLSRQNLVNNLNHGWICILDSPEVRPRCSKCGQELPATRMTFGIGTEKQIDVISTIID